MNKKKTVEPKDQLRPLSTVKEHTTINSIIEEDAERRSAEAMAAAEERARIKALQDQAAAERTEKIILIEASRKETDEELEAISRELEEMLASIMRSFSDDAANLIESEKEISGRAIQAEQAAEIIGIVQRFVVESHLAADLSRGAAKIASDPTALKGLMQYLARAGYVYVY